MRGWQVPAYTFPENLTGMAVMRIVVRKPECEYHGLGEVEKMTVTLHTVAGQRATPRVLVAARKSRVVRKGDDEVSIMRQDLAARHYAAELGDSDPLVAEDAGVSGSVSPFKRPDLGPYLTDNPPEPWTELVAAAIDRLGRNARDLYELRNWAADHGKRITILEPRLHWPVDPTDFASAIVWVVLEQLAEIELRMTRKRYEDTRRYLRDQKALIGRACWGFMIVGPKGKKTLAPDPSHVRWLLGIIDRAEGGDTLRQICEWLDAEGAPSKYGRRWATHSVGDILRNESLYGVYREGGRILLRHEGVIPRDRWQRLQFALDSRPKRRGPTRNDPMMLTDVIRCAHCHGIMHQRHTFGRVKRDGTRTEWTYYRCDGNNRERSACRNQVRADDIEPWVDRWFTHDGPFADTEIIETVYVPAKGYADEISDIEQEIAELMHDLDAPDFDRQLAELRTQRARLIDLGTEPAHTEDHLTGILLRDYWPTLTAVEKHDYLVRADVKVYAASLESEREAREAGEIAGDMNRWIEGDPRKVIGTLARKPSV
jgi:DNA invertase Pin-like site-specific DNA recombinase